jgi:hypothetical protein
VIYHPSQMDFCQCPIPRHQVIVTTNKVTFPSSQPCRHTLVLIDLTFQPCQSFVCLNAHWHIWQSLRSPRSLCQSSPSFVCNSASLCSQALEITRYSWVGPPAMHQCQPPQFIILRFHVSIYIASSIMDPKNLY